MKFAGRLFLWAMMIAALAQVGACTKTPPPPAKLMTSTLVAVCEHGREVVMLVIFTFDDGKTVIVDKDNAQGFTSMDELLQFAATAGDNAREYAEPCQGTST
jgi:hypothetical protein